MSDSSKTPDLLSAGQHLLLGNYKPQPVVMSRGAGCALWDSEDRRYLDMTAGIAVCALGHGDPGLAKAIADQASTLLHTSNLYFVETQLRFAQALAKRAFDGRAFFCNSGAEANEAALKLAKRFQSKVRGQPQRTEIVAFHNGFHGRTIGALSVTGQPKYHEGFEPLMPGVRFVDFGDIDALTEVVGDKTCAIILEPIQAEGGIVVPSAGYLSQVRDLCDQKGVVLIFDEVQTGVGRTGTFYGFEQEGVTPDVITLAKGIAGGVPMGVMLAGPKVADGFVPGTHASTFGGNPLACAAALYIQEAIDERGLLANCISAGAHLRAGLQELVKKYPMIAKEVRGRGLLLGVWVGDQAAPLMTKAREAGLLLSVAGGSVLRFVPPLIVTTAQIDEALAILDRVLEK